MLSKRKCGSLSVFMSMILLPFIIVLSLICESARISTQKAVFAASLYVSSYSSLSSYALELYDDYGLFCLYSSKDSLENDCLSFLKKNLMADNDTASLYKSFYRPEAISLSIDGITYITDKDCRLFAEEIINYSKDTFISDAVSDIKSFHSNVQAFGKRAYIPETNYVLDENSVEDLLDKGYRSNSGDLSGLYTNADEEIDINSISKSSLTDKIGKMITDSLLSMVIENPSALSSLSVDRTELPSQTIYLSDEALKEMELGFMDFDTDTSAIINDGLDKTFFVRYLDNMFTCYDDNKTKASTEKNELPLQYQLEYIISGKDSDKTNLLQTLTNLTSFRAGMNLIYLLGDSEKTSAAKKIAEAAVSYIPVPGITEAATYIILSLWATAEGIIDCRDLCSGKRVPLYKTDATWTLSLNGILSLSYDTPSKNSGKNGLNYREYLLAMIMLYNNTTTYLRTMDLVQMNIACKYKSDFLLSSCIYGFTANMSVTCKHIYNTLTEFPFKNRYSFNNSITISY